MLVWLLASAAFAEDPLHASITAGIGFPEIVHVELGFYVTPRVEVEARYGNVLLNSLVGVGVHGFLLGDSADRPPENALLVSGQAMINPTLSPSTVRSGGDVLAAYIGTYAGYAWHGEHVTVRVEGGPIFYSEEGPKVGLNGIASVGFVF